MGNFRIKDVKKGTMRKHFVTFSLVGMLLLVAPLSRAATVLVGQCIEFAPCWTSGTPTPWSDSLNLVDLASLGLGSNVPLTAAQTSAFFIRLGVTTFSFDTTTGAVTETLGEFNGNSQVDPCNFCEIDTVGTFFIPANALDGTISGTFGNSVVPNSAGVNVCLGSGPPCAPGATVPEPRMIGFLVAGFLGIVLTVRRRARLGNHVAS
jgi:hypothetical protein